MSAPVRYGEHAVAVPGTVCLLCGDLPLKLVADHCHEHGWVRGSLCSRCNRLMAFIDRRISVREPASLTLAALVAHASRCPDCEPFGVEDLKPTRRIGPEVRNGKVTVFLRIPRPHKERLAAYARAHGLTLNAAAIVVLDRALREARKPPG